MGPPPSCLGQRSIVRPGIAARFETRGQETTRPRVRCSNVPTEHPWISRGHPHTRTSRVSYDPGGSRPCTASSTILHPCSKGTRVLARNLPWILRIRYSSSYSVHRHILSRLFTGASPTSTSPDKANADITVNGRVAKASTKYRPPSTSHLDVPSLRHVTFA